MNNNYYCIVFEQNDFLKNQVIEELLRERAYYYLNKDISSDFWILLNPEFLKDKIIFDKLLKTKYFKKFNLKNNFYCSTLISSNIEFINWIQLRLGYFENFNNLEIDKDFKSDGVYLTLNSDDFTNEKLLSNNYLALTPEILTERFQSVG